MAPDDLKFVRMEARLQEQQQQLMAELGLGASPATSKVQAAGEAIGGSERAREAPIVSELQIESNMKTPSDEPSRPLAEGKRKISYGACEPVGKERSSETEKRTSSDETNKWAASCELAQFERNGPESDGAAANQSGEASSNNKLEERGDDEPPGLIQRLGQIIPCFGILLALCASFCLGTAGMLVKLIESVHGVEVAVLRAFIQIIIYVTIICMRSPSRWLPERGELLPVACRSLLGGASITFSYCALKLIPLGDATTIRFSLPIWTLIMGYFFLGEPCSFYKLVAVVSSLLGVVLVAKPDDCIRLLALMASVLFPHGQQQQVPPSGNSTHQIHAEGSFDKPEVPPDGQRSSGLPLDEMPLLVDASSSPLVALGTSVDPLRQFEGCSLALASSVCLAMSIIALRLCKRTPPEVTIFWLSVSSVSIGSLALVLLGEWSVPSGWLDCAFILLNGLCGALGQWFMTNALKVEQSGLVSLARTFDIEVAFLYSALLLGEEIRTTSIVGSVLVSLGVIIVLLPRLIERTNTARQAAANELAAGQPDVHSETDSTTTSTTVSMERDRAKLAAWPTGELGRSLDGRRSLADANAVDLLRRKLSERVQAAALASESPPATSEQATCLTSRGS